METFTGIAIVALAKQLMSLMKFITNRDWNGVITIAVAWIIGAIVILTVSKTSLGEGELFGIIITDQGVYGQIVLGMIVGAATGLAHDTLKAIKKTPGSEPPLIPSLARPSKVEVTETVHVPAQNIEVEPVSKADTDV